MAEKQLERNEKPQKMESVSDSDTSDEELLTNPCFPTTDEERHYSTIPGSAVATRVALSHSMAQSNSTVERGRPHQKTKVKNLPKDEADDKTSQTDPKEK